MRSAILLLALLASPALSQSADLSPVSRGDRIRERSVGFSWHSPRTGWGGVSHRRVYLVGLRNEWTLAAGGVAALSYVAELVPLAIVQRTAESGYLNCRQRGRFGICDRDFSTGVAVGAGALPVGFKLYLDRSSRTRMHLSAAGGGLLFNNDVPVHNSRRLNMAVQGGVGFDRIRNRGRALTFGYRYFHISNAGTGNLNPGLDAHVVYLGLLDRKRR